MQESRQIEGIHIRVSVSMISSKFALDTTTSETMLHCGNSRLATNGDGIHAAGLTMDKRFVSGHNFSCAEKPLLLGL